MQAQDRGKEDNSKSIDIQEIYINLPHNALDNDENNINNFFTKEVKKAIVSKEFLKSENNYYLSEAALYQKLHSEYIEEYEDNYVSVKIEKDKNLITTFYDSQSLYISADYVFFKQSDDFWSIIVFEYFPIINGNPSKNIVSRFTYNLKTKEYKSTELYLPEFILSDFFTPEDMQNISTELLEQDEMPLKYSVFYSNNKWFSKVELEIENLIYRYIGIFEHDFEDFPNEMEDYEMTKDSLGLRDLEPKILILQLPEFGRVEFE